MVNYSSEFIDRRDKYDDDETVGGSLNTLNDHGKAIKKVLELSNADLYKLLKACNILHNVIDNVNDDDDETGGGLFGDSMNKFNDSQKHKLGFGGSFKSFFKGIGKGIKNTVTDTVDLVKHPTPKNLVKLGAKAFIATSVSGNPLIVAGIGKGVDKGIDKMFGGSLKDHIKHGAKMGLKAAVPAAVGLATVNPYAAAGASYVSNKVIDHAFGGSMTERQHISHLKGALGDISKSTNVMSLVKMLENDHMIMAKNNEALSHFLHALHMCHKVSNADYMKNIM
jgi:hypothetical protein